MKQSITLLLQGTAKKRAAPEQPVNHNLMRDDVKSKIKEEVAKKVAYLCSNPKCRAPTSGPQINDGTVNVGVAAHITAASENGPRYDPSLTAEERSSAENAIWLCQTHAKLIDNDPDRFNVELLRLWKKQAEKYAIKIIGKPQQINSRNDDLKLFQITVEAYKKKGTPKHFLDSQNLSNEQKADLYDRIFCSEKGRYSKNNPYKGNG